jgi:hypothetical protein
VVHGAYGDLRVRDADVHVTTGDHLLQREQPPPLEQLQVPHPGGEPLLVPGGARVGAGGQDAAALLAGRGVGLAPDPLQRGPDLRERAAHRRRDLELRGGDLTLRLGAHRGDRPGDHLGHVGQLERLRVDEVVLLFHAQRGTDLARPRLHPQILPYGASGNVSGPATASEGEK